MKPGALDKTQRAAAPVENHLVEFGLLIKRTDLIRPMPAPDGQGAVWPDAVTAWIASEVILTFEQADRSTFQYLRTVPWLVDAGQPEEVSGLREGLRACVGPQACLIVLGSPRGWWQHRGRETLKQAVLWGRL